MSDDVLARRPPVWHYEEEPQPDGTVILRPVLDAESRAELNRIMAEAEPPDSLDDALPEAEAALPEGCHLVMRGRSVGPLRSLDRLPTRGYRASAVSVGRVTIIDSGWHLTPAAALRALETKLREVGR